MTTQAVSPLVRSLRSIAPLIGDLVGQVAGLRSKPDADGSGYAKALEAPLPMNATAFDDANALFLHLANEVLYEAAWLDKPPVIPAWRSESGAIVGLRSGTTPREALMLAGALTDWLEDRLALLPEHAVDALLFEVREISKRHPFRDRASVSTTAVCPDCSGALRVTPPRHHGDAQRVTCLACGVTLGEAEYAQVEHQYQAVLARAKVVARAKGVAARLAAKYAPVTV